MKKKPCCGSWKNGRTSIYISKCQICINQIVLKWCTQVQARKMRDDQVRSERKAPESMYDCCIIWLYIDLRYCISWRKTCFFHLHNFPVPTRILNLLPFNWPLLVVCFVFFCCVTLIWFRLIDKSRWSNSWLDANRTVLTVLCDVAKLSFSSRVEADLNLDVWFTLHLFIFILYF